MNQQFGRVVAALRKEHLDENLTPWSQGRLGEITGLGAEIIAKVEQGKRAPDAVLVATLADALQLSVLERREFLTLAVGMPQQIPRSRAGASDQTLHKLLDLLSSIPLPAFFHDDYGDMIAANSAASRFSGTSRQAMAVDRRFSHIRYHTMRLIFDPSVGYIDLLGAAWPEIAARQLQLFRRISLRHRGSAHLSAILMELRQLPAFRRLWAEAPTTSARQDSGFIEYEHLQPDTGRSMHYLGLPTPHPTPWGELVLAVFVPLNADSTSVFAELSRPNSASPFALWPKPLEEG